VDDEEKPATQIPLMSDVVFDESLPLRPPRKSSSKKATQRVNYSPDYDPDTIDLFGEQDSLAPEIDGTVTEKLKHSADQVIDELVDEYSAEFGRRLRGELTAHLSSILEDLNDKG
jgi:hypothetical protein